MAIRLLAFLDQRKNPLSKTGSYLIYSLLSHQLPFRILSQQEIQEIGKLKKVAIFRFENFPFYQCQSNAQFPEKAKHL